MNRTDDNDKDSIARTAAASSAHALVWRVAHDRVLPLDRARIMGILNVTPDSFSDGGLYERPADAVDHALRMIDEGAEIIDIGAESTRPGARRITANTQLARALPVIRRLRAVARDDVLISIDTTQSEVARAALEAGANIINDTSACTDDEGMIALAAEFNAGVILMHRLRPPRDDSYSDAYTEPPQYTDVVGEVREFLARRVERVTSGGVEQQRIVVDPGFGFGKSVEQNFMLAARIMEVAMFGGRALPVLSAASRKSFIGSASGGIDEPSRRVAGSVAVSVAHFLRGVRLFRVHDVRPHREGLGVAAALSGPWERAAAS